VVRGVEVVVSEFPRGAVTACAVTADGQVLTCCQVNQATGSIVTAITGVVVFQIASLDQWWWIVMTSCTTGRSNLNQGGVSRGDSRVGCLKCAAMTGRTGTSASRCSWDAWLQGRYGGMAECTIVHVGRYDRTIICSAAIVTGQTGRCARGDEPGRNVIDAAVSSNLVRVTIQTVSRVSTGRDSSNNLASCAVVTGITGTSAISGDVVLGAFDFCPVSNHVTAAPVGTG